MAALDPTSVTSKRVVYVGGLADEITVQLVRAAMIPFGNIKSVDVPMDYSAGTHRGFAFVEYHEPEDADEAIFNMDGAELCGKTIRVSLAQPNQINKLSASEPIWSSDEWFQKHMGRDKETLDMQRYEKEDASTLKG